MSHFVRWTDLSNHSHKLAGSCSITIPKSSTGYEKKHIIQGYGNLLSNNVAQNGSRAFERVEDIYI